MARRASAGFTLLEVLISMSLLVIVLFSYTRVSLSTTLATATNHESAIAKEAAREMLERLHAEDFADVYALYNATDLDDPGGAGTGPGAAFAVPGLEPLTGDPDGMAGEVLFPELGAAPGVLRENLVLPFLGLPADLDGDGVIDGQDHSADCRMIPVMVRIEWNSSSGPASCELRTVLGDY